ncbi:NACHT domain-containing protein [Rariglobus hedericola]|uniref:ATP-binding protein n=1 Tax=Rariglobus hedericola TaxID=2597822 RepID=A0A556QNV0_9BACT|nr:ATP-binding protein [Rariglobus hedericola]TSJ78314.1 ATP-binding protein [Rariglobus hedericola]
MPALASAPIDYQLIRPVKGTRHSGFEELCVSLFREEMGNPQSMIRIDGAGGDGGVEAYFVDTSKKTVGLQAKFFPQLRDPQWKQIAESIQRARENHPTLKVYYVAVPLDLNPSTAKKWKALQNAARGKRPSLQLIWWGASELTGMLTVSRHAGRAAYWFGCPQFDEKWLSARNQEARNALDTRYTPKQHVRVQVQDVLSALARDPRHITRFYQQAREVWKAMRKATEYPPPKEFVGLLKAPFNVMAKAAEENLSRLGDGESLPPMDAARLAAERMQEAVIKFSEAVRLAKEEAKKMPAPARPADGSYQPRPEEQLGFRQHELDKAIGAIYDFRQFIDDHIAADRRRLLVTGEAGTGKSHLLARLVEECGARGQTALFLLGEFFTTSAEPWSQLVARLGWKGDADDLLAALNHAGEVRGLPALLVIDAINESPERAVWFSHLAAFSNRIDAWPHVRLIVSCRSDFGPICLPATIARQQDSAWAFSKHYGFGDTTFEATARYFAAYGVRARDLPPLLAEFQNPLFLKTFCEAFENSSVPAGPITLDVVMRKRITRTANLLKDTIDCPSDVTHEAVNILATLVADAEGQPVPITTARAKIDALFPGRPLSRSLFHHLCSSGLVTEVGHYDYATRTSEVRVRFAYERFSDYFVAGRLLAGVKSLPQLVQNWKTRGLIAYWRTYEGYYAHRGLLKALAILLPEKFKMELASVVNGRKIREALLEDFLASVPWRSPTSFTPNSHALMAKARVELTEESVLAVLIRTAGVTGHPFNAEFIDRWLRELPLWQRELEWTIPTSQQLADYGETSMPTTFIRWLFTVDSSRLSNEQATLVSTLLCWFFSSNDRRFRRRATLAAIRVVTGRSELAAKLIEAFYAIDDSYVVERVFAVAAGVAVREKDPEKLSVLAKVVWKRVFAAKQVPPHVLQRDFAFTVMECARNLQCLPPGVSHADYSPPYRSSWPKIWSEKKARAFGRPDGWHTIVSSIEPEYGNGVGGYGDFGRYVMESHMHHWLNVRRNRPYPSKEKRRAFKGLVARAWTLQRIVELGWTPERFVEYERNLPYRGRSADEDTKQERISKKYQWIALHELEGYASDHFHFGRQWDDSPEKFEGAWQLYSRNFDPAQPLRDPVAAKEPEAETKNEWWKGSADPFAEPTLVKNPSKWVATLPENPGEMLSLPSAPGFVHPALLLNAWISWDEPESYPPRTSDKGSCHQFMHFRSWLVPKAELAQRVKFLQKMHFWGDGVQVPQFGSEGLGEYPWSSRFDRVREACAAQKKFGGEFPAGFVHTVAEYSEGDTSASVPSPQLAGLLGVKWTGNDFTFSDANGKVVVFAPRQAPRSSTPPCLVDRAQLLGVLAKHKLALIWSLVGERSCHSEMATGSVADKLMSFSGVFVLEKDGSVSGGITARDITLLKKQEKGVYSGATRHTRELLHDGKVTVLYDEPSRQRVISKRRPKAG